MAQADDIINGASDLNQQLWQCYTDDIWSQFQTQLAAAHSTLSTEIYQCLINKPGLDSAPAAQADQTIASCGNANSALAGAASTSAQQMAIAATYVAIHALAGMLPASTLPVIFGS